MRFPTFPLNTKAYPGFSVPMPETANGDELFFAAGKPCFHILTDNGIADQFLAAVAANPDEAWAFVSKHYAGAIDLEALRDVLGQTTRWCRPLVRASYSSDPKNCLTRSVMVVDPERNIKSLLHLHMIKEPDRYGQWKIYGVEQE